MPTVMRLGPSHGRNRLARWLAAALLLALLSPLTFSLAGCTVLGLVAAIATKPKPRLIPAGDALHLEPGMRLHLALADGSTLRGRFVGRRLLPPESYAPRFARQSSAWRPIALGETLRVLAMDGRLFRGAFRGYAVRSLVIHDAAGDVRIAFDASREVRRGSGDLIAVDSLRAADERGELPSLEALAIEPADRASSSIVTRSATLLPYDDIRGTTVRTEQGMKTGYIVLGVVVDVLVLVIAVAALATSSPGCTVSEISLADAMPPPRWTERPFDRHLARFVDEWDAAPGLASAPFDRTWAGDTTASPPAGDANVLPPEATSTSR